MRPLRVASQIHQYSVASAPMFSTPPPETTGSPLGPAISVTAGTLIASKPPHTLAAMTALASVRSTDRTNRQPNADTNCWMRGRRRLEPAWLAANLAGVPSSAQPGGDAIAAPPRIRPRFAIYTRMLAPRAVCEPTRAPRPLGGVAATRCQADRTACCARPGARAASLAQYAHTPGRDHATRASVGSAPDTAIRRLSTTSPSRHSIGLIQPPSP